MQPIKQPGSDRDRQDQIIHYLSDASIRSAEPAHELLDPEQLSRAHRFSRFLARRYYRDRLSRGFRYSARLGHQIAAIADCAEFEPILDGCVLGSFTTASRVGDLACSHLLSLRTEAWWHELLEYERAFFLQIATSEHMLSGDFPSRSASAILREFHVPISELLTNLRSGAQIADCVRVKANLLFSRTSPGKIYVAEVDETTSKVFESVNGTRSADEIRDICGISIEEVLRVLSTLSEIGSIVLPSAHDLA